VNPWYILNCQLVGLLWSDYLMRMCPGLYKATSFLIRQHRIDCVSRGFGNSKRTDALLICVWNSWLKFRFAPCEFKIEYRVFVDVPSIVNGLFHQYLRLVEMCTPVRQLWSTQVSVNQGSVIMNCFVKSWQLDLTSQLTHRGIQYVTKCRKLNKKNTLSVSISVK